MSTISTTNTDKDNSDKGEEENIYMNKIDPSKRFAKRGEQEFHVFSLKSEDPADIKNWLQILKPLPVLMDPQSFEELKNNKMNWVFDKEKVLVGCTIKK
tara:strand:+ start:2481 stop:2777 length:297 start_codon:yes stop_codon:yes gene_type:complete